MSGNVRRILAATDRSPTAERAVAWAAEMAQRYDAELIVLHVVVPDRAAPQVEQRAETQAADERTRTKVLVHANPARAILDTAREEAVDVIVVGNVGLKSRRRFLTGNVPSAVVHGSTCAVVVVDTEEQEPG